MTIDAYWTVQLAIFFKVSNSVMLHNFTDLSDFIPKYHGQPTTTNTLISSRNQSKLFTTNITNITHEEHRTPTEN